MNAQPATGGGDERMLALASAVAIALVLPVVLVAGHLHVWMVAALAIGAALAYGRRDSWHGLVALAVVALVWIAAQPDPGSVWSLAVALLMFTTHACLAVQATAPPGADLGRALRKRWVARSAVVAGATVSMYVAAVAARHLPHSDAGTGMAVGLVLVAGLVLLLRQETLRGATARRRDDVTR